jgi:hypothetical protein
MSDLMEYIKIQWADIHHCRNQDWKFLFALGGLYVGLLSKGLDDDLKVAVAVAGIIVCAMGFYTSFVHWRIFYNKIQIIGHCEMALGIKAKFQKSIVPVQSIIVLLYVLLGTVLLGWLVWLLTNSLLYFSLASSLSFIVGSVITLRLAFKLNEKNENSDSGEEKVLVLNGRLMLNCRKQPIISTVPLYAELDDLAKCLNFMKQRPLKLISDTLYEDESPWKEGKWSFEIKDRDIIDKKLLLNPRDVFQFSIANERSIQEFHQHNEVAEIFITQSPMKIYYGQKGKESPEISKGILVVPPGVRHKTELSGLTFVFQCAVNGGMVHDDREVI